MLYISGLGSSESYLNGKRISNDVFAPMPSLYTSRVYYNVYDVTDLLQQGENLLGVVLGNGRYFSMRVPGMLTTGLPSLLAQLEVEYTDGSVDQVVSDTSWKVTSQGPIVANNEFDGEEYDARKELKGWNTLSFDDSAWKTADVMKAEGSAESESGGAGYCRSCKRDSPFGWEVYLGYGPEYGWLAGCKTEREKQSADYFPFF